MSSLNLVNNKTSDDGDSNFIVLNAIKTSDDLTYNLDLLAHNSINNQIKHVKDISKPFIATAGLVRRSLTDEDHFPYTRRYRGAPVLCDPQIMDRAAGFRPRQDACYASAAIVTGITNLTGTQGFVCGSSLHADNSQPLDNTIEAFDGPRKPTLGASAKYVSADVRDPVSKSGTYPISTSSGGSSYARVPHGAVGGKSAYAVTCYQSSCNTQYPCHAQRKATMVDPSIFRL